MEIKNLRSRERPRISRGSRNATYHGRVRTRREINEVNSSQLGNPGLMDDKNLMHKIRTDAKTGLLSFEAFVANINLNVDSRMTNLGSILVHEVPLSGGNLVPNVIDNGETSGMLERNSSSLMEGNGGTGADFAPLERRTLAPCHNATDLRTAERSNLAPKIVKDKDLPQRNNDNPTGKDSDLRKMVARLGFRRRKTARFAAFMKIVGEGSEITEGVACQWLRRPLLTAISDSFVPSSDLQMAASVGFKYCLPLPRRELCQTVDQELRCEWKRTKDKIGRCLKSNGRPSGAFRAPPSQRVPNINWSQFPLWEHFFSDTERLLKEDAAFCRLISNEDNAHALGIRNRLLSAVQDTLESGHFICQSDKDMAMVVVQRNLFLAATSQLLGTLDVVSVQQNSSEIIFSCRNFLHRIGDYCADFVQLPRVVTQLLQEDLHRSIKLPRLKLMFKTHKPLEKWWMGGRVPPARPIVTQVCWFTNNASKILTAFLSRILDSVRMDHPITILKDSSQLVRFLETQNLLGKKVFGVTGDFDNLYSKLPLLLVAQSVDFFAKKYATTIGRDEDFLFLYYHVPGWFGTDFPSFLRDWERPVATLLDALVAMVCTLNIFETPLGGNFAQVSGIAMGLGCAPQLADLALAYKEMSNPMLFSQKKIFRYLDDVCVLHEDSSKIGDFLTQITKAYELKIGWDCPIQQEQVCHFLDVELRNVGRGLEVGVFFKPTHSGLYLPFSTSHPFQQKTCWITGELIRYIRICTSEELFDQARKRLLLAVFARGYPLNLVRRLFDKVGWTSREEFCTPKRKSNTDQLVVGHKSIFCKNRKFTFRCDLANPGIRQIKLPPPSLAEYINRKQNKLMFPVSSAGVENR